MIANVITFSRIIFSLLLLILSPDSFAFAALYLLCGLTDVLDGFIARKLHTESKTGAALDSIADLFFCAAYAVKVIPVMDIPFRIWIWTAMIAAIKITVIILKSKKDGKISIEHSLMNKLTGAAIFILPLSIHAVNIAFGAAFVCLIATITVIVETTGISGSSTQ